MKMSLRLFIALIAGATCFSSCKSTTNNTATMPIPTPTQQVISKAAGPLPANGFSAEVSFPAPPAKLRTGQVEVIGIKVKNTSDVIWFRRGGEINNRTDNIYYIAAGNRWLDKDGKLTTETEGHNGIPKDLKPGEETDMTLQITAPKTPGEWIMQLDMVQEGVAWFSEKGSPPTNIKIMVVK